VAVPDCAPTLSSQVNPALDTSVTVKVKTPPELVRNIGDRSLFAVGRGNKGDRSFLKGIILGKGNKGDRSFLDVDNMLKLLALSSQ